MTKEISKMKEEQGLILLLIGNSFPTKQTKAPNALSRLPNLIENPSPVPPPEHLIANWVWGNGGTLSLSLSLQLDLLSKEDGGTAGSHHRMVALGGGKDSSKFKSSNLLLD